MKFTTKITKCFTLLVLTFFAISCSKQEITPDNNSGNTPTSGNSEIVLDGVWTSNIDDIQFISFSNGRYSLYYESILSNGTYLVKDEELTLSDDFTGKTNTLTISSYSNNRLILKGNIVQIDIYGGEHHTYFNLSFRRSSESTPDFSLTGLTLCGSQLPSSSQNHESYFSYIRFESNNQLYKYCQETGGNQEIFATSNMFYVYRHDYVIAKKTHEMLGDAHIYYLCYTGNLVTGFYQPYP